MKAGDGLIATIHVDATAESRGQPQQEQQVRFRVPGSKAGSFPHTPWHHCVFHDPYERVNVWSHSVPGAVFLTLALVALIGGNDGGWPLAIFGFCAACTHLLSALTHVYPDSHALEKLDHLGIVVLIIGTPMTALMSKEHGGVPVDMIVSTLAMIVAACLPPLLRVLGFTAGIASMVLLHFNKIMNLNLASQLVLYGLGGISFLRNAGHSRWPGFADHHLLHYFVTIACVLHVYYIWTSMKAPAV